MKFSEVCYGPLEDVANWLDGDWPPSDPEILRAILARCVREVVELRRMAAASPDGETT